MLGPEGIWQSGEFYYLRKGGGERDIYRGGRGERSENDEYEISSEDNNLQL